MKARLPMGMGGGAGNMNQMIKQAQKMQEEMSRIQEELDVKEYSVSVGGGMVNATVNGKKELIDLKLKPEVINPDEADMLVDLIKAAVNEAVRQVSQEKEDKLGAVAGGLNIPGMY